MVEINLKSIVSIIAIMTLFFGIISSISYDILLLISKPSQDSVMHVIKDLASMVVNSQSEIGKAVEEFPNAETNEYRNYLLGRIVAGSLATVFLIWLFYRIIRFFKETAGPIEKVTMVLLSVFMVWIIGVVASYIVGKPDWIIFSGWIKLIQNKDVIAKYIMYRYFT